MSAPVDSDAIVVNCPKCHRTIWGNSTCHHGEPILTPVKLSDDPALSEPAAAKTSRKKLRGGTEP